MHTSEALAESIATKQRVISLYEEVNEGSPESLRFLHYLKQQVKEDIALYAALVPVPSFNLYAI